MNPFTSSSCFVTFLLVFFFAGSSLYSQPNMDSSPGVDAWAQQMFASPPRELLLPEFEDSYGVVFRDINNSGYPDIYVVRFRELNRLFVNQGPGKVFLDYTIQSGLGGNLMSRGEENLELGASAVDFNNDGWQDVLIVGWGVTTYLFHQKSKLEFPENTPLAVDHFPLDGNGGFWADVDRDGDLDLFITDEHYENHLFINDGLGNLREKSEAFGVALTAVSQGAAFADVDGDDYPDLYVCNWFAPDVFYKNIEGKRFQPVQLSLLHLQDSLNSNGVTFGDVDNDGDPDLLVTDRQGATRLYRNLTQPGDTLWQFEDVTKAWHLENPFPAYGSIIADFNNDGWQDIFLCNIGPNRFFLNEQGGGFRLVYQETISSASTHRHYSTGAAAADYDNDGDIDLFVANKDTNSILYINPLNNSNFIRFTLDGVISNRDAIGSKIWLYEMNDDEEAATPAGYREISGGGGYLSLSEPAAHFGVQKDKVYRARIRFPSGKEIMMSNLLPGNVYHIEETGGVRKAFIRALQQINRLIHGRQFWLNAALFLILVGMVSGFLRFSLKRYQWENKQTATFLITTLVISYALFWLLSEMPPWRVLLTQIAALVFLMAILAVFMEKIHRLEAQRYGYRQILRNFSQQLIFIKNNAELYEQMTQTIHKALGVRFCSALEIRNSTANPAACAGTWQFSQKALPLTTESRAALERHTILKPDEIASLLPQFAATQCHLILSLSRKEKLFALLLLGERTDGKAFRQEDLDLLQILAGQAAIAIENNLYIEETKALIQKLTEAELREKYVKELEEKNDTLQKLYRELQDTQAQLIQSEKMASLGQLVAGVAHELNNPISFIYANMKELQRYISAIDELLALLTQLPEDGAAVPHLKQQLKELNERYDLAFIQQDIDQLIAESLEGSQRVKEVVQHLRNFSRLDEADIKEVDLHEGLESTLLLLSHEIKNRIQVHRDYGQLPRVLCNPGQINQVFMNLLVNASQAIEGKGDIWIRTRQRGENVEIEIRDNGRGIPEEIQSKIFDPFFTTKPVGAGTGLGLSISYNIIQRHGGKILLESKPGRGSVFTIVLPVHSQPLLSFRHSDI